MTYAFPVFEVGDIVIPNRKGVPPGVAIGVVIEIEDFEKLTPEDYDNALYGIYWDTGEVCYCLDRELILAMPI